MHLFKINVLTFNFYVFFILRNQGFIFRKTVVYAGMVWYSVFHVHWCRQSCSLLILMHVKHTTPYLSIQPSS